MGKSPLTAGNPGDGRYCCQPVRAIRAKCHRHAGCAGLTIGCHYCTIKMDEQVATCSRPRGGHATAARTSALCWNLLQRSRVGFVSLVSNSVTGLIGWTSLVLEMQLDPCIARPPTCCYCHSCSNHLGRTMRYLNQARGLGWGRQLF